MRIAYFELVRGCVILFCVKSCILYQFCPICENFSFPSLTVQKKRESLILSLWEVAWFYFVWNLTSSTNFAQSENSENIWRKFWEYFGNFLRILSLSFIIHHYLSLSIIICHYLSLPIIIYHYSGWQCSFPVLLSWLWGLPKLFIAQKTCKHL